jgi:hypothetical protein
MSSVLFYVKGTPTPFLDSELFRDNNFYSIYGTALYVGFAYDWQVGTSGNLYSAEFYAYKSPSQSKPGNVQAELWSSTAGLGSGAPESLLETSSLVSANSLPDGDSNRDWVSFSFAGTTALSAGNTYFIAIRYDDGSSSQRVFIRGTNGGSDPGRGHATTGGVAWGMTPEGPSLEFSYRVYLI